jgi:homoserine kinase type II
MALLTPLELSDAKLLGEQYGLEITRVEALALGSVNSNFRLESQAGRVFFARIYEEQDAGGAAAEARMLEALSRVGVPTAVPLVPRASGELAAGLSRALGLLLYRAKPFAIYPWLEGESLCHARVTPEHCERLGEALARVHLASQSFESLPEGRFGVSGIAARIRNVSEQTHAYDADLELLRERLERYGQVRPDLPMGLVHGDLFRDNVLWQGSQLAALLDFESAYRGVLIYDLMVCALAWCYTSQFQLDRVAGLFKGYQRLRPLGAAERAALVSQGGLACVRFASTRLTDFELRAKPGQKPGRDYRRFLDRMRALENGALSAIL